MLASDASDIERGDPDVVRSYEQELLAWVQKYKRYPKRLKRRGVEGKVILAFTVGSGGDLLHYEILQGSGEIQLDKAALAILKDAAPMPAIPEDLDMAEYTVRIPVSYTIR
ncbi:MAG: energy transducer TonB [Granulosicoccus sp.]